MITGEGYDREAVFHYAEQVAAGFRQPMPPHWPQKVRALIADCWHQVCWLWDALQQHSIRSAPGQRGARVVAAVLYAWPGDVRSCF